MNDAGRVSHTFERGFRRRGALMLLGLGLSLGIMIAILGDANRARARAHAASAKSQFVVCSDEVEPPFAYRNGSTLTGSEIEISTDAAKLMGGSVTFSQVGFDGLFAALDAGKCSMAIDEVSDTPQREQTITDVDYMAVGQTFMVKHGNPQHLNSFTNLCGHTVGAVLASVDLQYLHVLTHNCTTHGKRAIRITGFNDDPTGVEALITNKIDAFEEDTPILAGLIARSGGQVQLSPQRQVRRIPVGIAVAKNNTKLATALEHALNQLYRNHEIPKILAKYHETGVVLSGTAPVKIDVAGRK